MLARPIQLNKRTSLLAERTRPWMKTEVDTIRNFAPLVIVTGYV